MRSSMTVTILELLAAVFTVFLTPVHDQLKSATIRWLLTKDSNYSEWTVCKKGQNLTISHTVH